MFWLAFTARPDGSASIASGRQQLDFLEPRRSKHPMTHLPLTPLFASGALQFAFEKSTIEGKLTIGALLILSLFSWTIMLTKFYQLYRARRVGRKFYAAYTASRDPLDIQRKGEEFEGAPAFALYIKGAEELAPAGAR